METGLPFCLFTNFNSLTMFTPLVDFPIEDQQVAVIGNSQTIAVGDVLVPGATGHTKFLVTGKNTTGMLVGVATAILGAPGKQVTELQSVTTGSSNETTPVYYVRYIPLGVPGLKFKATLSAAGGTTTNSDGFGSFNVSATDAGKLDETSIALFSATEKQFFSLGLDQTDNTKLTVIGSFAKTLTP